MRIVTRKKPGQNQNHYPNQGCTGLAIEITILRQHTPATRLGICADEDARASRNVLGSTHVQADAHLLQGNRGEIINVDTPRAELFFGVWRHKSSDEVGARGELCPVSIALIGGTVNVSVDPPSRVKSNSAGKSLPFGNLAPSTRSSSKNS